MKTNRQRRSNKKIIIIALIVVLVLGIGGAVGAYYINNLSGNKSVQGKSDQVTPEGINNSDATDEQIKAGVDIKNQSQTQTDTPKAGDPITLSITAPSDGMVSGSTAHIRLLIDIVTSTGSCTMTMVNGSTTISKEVGIQAGPSSSTCKGFDITDLTPGEWKTTVKVVSGDREGSVSKTITVQ